MPKPINRTDEFRLRHRLPIYRGVRVTVDGKPGSITGIKGDRIMVRFDDRKFSVPCHPWWRVVYHVAVRSAIRPFDIATCMD